MPFMEWGYTVRGVTFLGETKQPIHIRMNGHMYDIKQTITKYWITISFYQTIALCIGQR